MHAIAVSPDQKISLDKIPTTAPEDLDKDRVTPVREALDEELFFLQELMWGARQHSLLIVLQGRDTAGKDGTIKGVVGALNPRGVQVVSFGVPSEEERAHDFLWRVHRHAPRLGEVSIFNRSHYEDVLVTRVHGLVPKKVWQGRFAHINAFERVLTEHGCLVLKFFLHISKDEQKERLIARERDPAKAWKLDPNDWRERAHWQAFTKAYEDVLARCTREEAPWFVVPADQKWYRNLCVCEAIVKTLRPHRKGWLAALADKGKMGRAALEDYKRKTAKRRPPR